MSIIPSIWVTAIVTPIPKGKGKDPRVPLHYRGISLLSTIYKVNSSVLNHRLATYLETSGQIVDHQNGFPHFCAYIDHLLLQQ